MSSGIYHSQRRAPHKIYILRFVEKLEYVSPLVEENTDSQFLILHNQYPQPFICIFI